MKLSEIEDFFEINISSVNLKAIWSKTSDGNYFYNIKKMNS